MQPRRPKTRRQFQTLLLIVAVVGIWVGILFDPNMRPLALAGGGLVAFGLLAVGGAMLLGYIGFGLDRALTRSARSRTGQEEDWPEFSPRSETIPAAKPSGPGRMARYGPPMLVLSVACVFLISILGNPFDLLQWIFGGLVICFGVGVVLALFAGITMALAQWARGLARRLGGRDEAESPWMS